MFPEIEDWTGQQNQLRNAKVKDLDFWHFVWFHPIAYAILKLGIPFNFLIWSIVFCLKTAKYGISIAFGIPFVLTVICLVWLFKEINRMNIYLETNMYDLLLKD